MNKHLTKNNLIIILIVLFIILSALRIGITVYNQHAFSNKYNIEYGTDVYNYSSIEELEEDYEEYNCSKIIETDQMIRESLNYITDEYESEYAIELEEEDISDFQLTYDFEDQKENDWTVYYDYQDGSIHCEIDTASNNIQDIVYLDFIDYLVTNLYQRELGEIIEIERTIEEENDSDNFYYSNGDINLEVLIDEEEEITEINLYLS